MNDQLRQEKINTYNQSVAGGLATALPPLTLASAVGHMDTANQRLVKLRDQINHLADMIGGPRPANSQIAKDDSPPVGAVYALNRVADRANSIISDIEETLVSVLRSLG